MFSPGECGRRAEPNAVNARAHERIIRLQGQRHLHWIRAKDQKQLRRGEVTDTDFSIGIVQREQPASFGFAGGLWPVWSGVIGVRTKVGRSFR